LACGSEGVCGADVCLAAAAVCAFMVTPVLLLLFALDELWHRTAELNTACPATVSREEPEDEAIALIN
jgi:hypothetical protein